MPIPRFHLFEFEDQTWFPRVIRDLATDYLHRIEVIIRMHERVLGPLGEALRASGSERVVDLCSGAGGPVPALQRALAAGGLDLPFTLTDRFPNLPAFRRTEAVSEGRIRFIAEPVDARAVPGTLTGLRTLFNSFHHFPPADSRTILLDAVEDREPIAIFEISERALPMFLFVFLTPVFVLLATPFIRPFRWRRLFWTYVLPLVPLVCWWDGMISQLRTYTVSELEELTRGDGFDSYEWRTGRLPIAATPGHVTFLVGLPR
jgi:hypothetical protein